ncbi:hypothetical protein ACIRRA_02940 [Nocardia sp. NPDC101769]|uniref:hypothetical protein n=1 Tax=Nocardia sp. NPDC101769 TaxID=3364333 RepID=UPI0038119CC7
MTVLADRPADVSTLAASILETLVTTTGAWRLEYIESEQLGHPITPPGDDRTSHTDARKAHGRW